MSEIIKLVPSGSSHNAEVQADIIAKLEEMLVLARTGALDGIMIITAYADGSTGNSYSKANSYARMVGAMVDCQHRYVSRHHQEQQA